jgi:hypothetical protein
MNGATRPNTRRVEGAAHSGGGKNGARGPRAKLLGTNNSANNNGGAETAHIIGNAQALNNNLNGSAAKYGTNTGRGGRDNERGRTNEREQRLGISEVKTVQSVLNRGRTAAHGRGSATILT